MAYPITDADLAWVGLTSHQVEALRDADDETRRKVYRAALVNLMSQAPSGR